MMFNATFNNISDISWRSVVLVEETEYSEKTTDLPQVTDNFFSHNVDIEYASTERDSNSQR
jgi:hypothetical protein